MAVIAGCSNDSDLQAPNPEDSSGKAGGDGPLPVENLQVANDKTLWGTVHISWDKPLPNAPGFEVEEYHLVVNTSGGSITAANWDQMTVLGIIDATRVDSYSVTFDNTDGAIVGGILESFAVRPLYRNDVLGPIRTVASLTPTLPHYQWGFVKDELGNPLANVTVRMVEPTGINDPRGFVSEQVTDANGMFNLIGPIPDSATMILETDSPDTVSAPGAEDAYFDYRTLPLEFGQFTSGYKFALITKCDLDYEMTSSLNMDFVIWLQRMGRAYNIIWDFTLRKFPSDAYPLKVYIPDGVSDSGWDMDEHMRSALFYLNTQIGDSLFVETTSSGEAQIVVEFPESMENFYGKTQIIEPSGTTFGYVVPEKVKVSISRVTMSENYLIHLCRHELVHAIGHYNHVNGAFFLMSVSSSTNEISSDEVRVIQALLGLPNEILMSNYEGSMPDYPTY